MDKSFIDQSEKKEVFEEDRTEAYPIGLYHLERQISSMEASLKDMRELYLMLKHNDSLKCKRSKAHIDFSNFVDTFVFQYPNRARLNRDINFDVELVGLQKIIYDNLKLKVDVSVLKDKVCSHELWIR